MTSWRMDLTVLTDLSASMFAACFIILLVFLGLAQQRDASPPPPLGRIEASEALRIVRQETLTPAAMVELLRGHGGPAAGAGIDLYADRIEVHGAAGRATLAPAQIAGRLAAELRVAGGGPVRLYVFSNALYNAAGDALARAGIRPVELTVPRALRDPAAPDHGWSPAFLDLSGRSLDAASFRRELAALLAGSDDAGAGAPGAQQAEGAPEASDPPRSASALLERLRQWLSAAAAAVFMAAGLAAVLWIERRRFRPARAE